MWVEINGIGDESAMIFGFSSRSKIRASAPIVLSFSTLKSLMRPFAGILLTSPAECMQGLIRTLKIVGVLNSTRVKIAINFCLKAACILIVVESNIGVEKSRLTKALVEKLCGFGIYKPVQSNLYVADFYKNPKR